jgi:nickel-dependent lactate racemase
MDRWLPLLDRQGIDLLGPRASLVDLGHATPAAALAAAGGPPRDGRGPLLVAVNDPARATDTAPALAALRASIGDGPMRVVVATGSHVHGDDARRAHEERLRSAAGEPTEWRWHDPADEAQAEIGGYRADPWLAEAGDVVAIGSVEPHWFAGLTGAHKTLSVGLMSAKGIARSHRLALDPAARPLRLAGNPVHEEIARTAAALLQDRRALGLAHLGDRWVAGDPLATTEACLEAARRRWEWRVAAPLDFLVAVVDPPLDRVLYQAEKGLKNSEHAVQGGGAIVIDAGCAGGIGPRRFVDLLARAPDHAAVVAALGGDGYRLGDHKAARWRALQERGVEICVVSSALPEDDVRAAGLRTFAGAAQATEWLAARYSRGAVVADAAHTVVSVGEK